MPTEGELAYAAARRDESGGGGGGQYIVLSTVVHNLQSVLDMLAPCLWGVCGAGVGGRGGRQCDNHSDKRHKSGKTRGNSATRGKGTRKGRDGVRRGNTTTSRTKGPRAAEQEVMARQEEKAAAPSDLLPRPSPPGKGARRWDAAA
jgi:hypothetical protein